jgi:hypothetical protein
MNDNSSILNVELPEMKSLFTVDFNYDWTLDYDTPEEVLDAYKRETGNTHLQKLKKELEFVLKQNVNDKELQNLLNKKFDSGFPYEAKWSSAKDWLKYVYTYLFPESAD